MDPGHHQPRHSDELGPKHFYDLLILPGHINRCIWLHLY